MIKFKTYTNIIFKIRYNITNSIIQARISKNGWLQWIWMVTSSGFYLRYLELKFCNSTLSRSLLYHHSQFEIK